MSDLGFHILPREINVQMSKEHRRDGELELMRKRHVEKLQGCGRDGMDEVNGTGCR